MTHDPHDGLSPSARALLGRASAPRPRTPEERRRTTQRVARLAVAPLVAGGAWFSWKGALLAAALVAGGVGVAVARRTPNPSPTPTARVAPRALTPPAAARVVEAPAPMFGPPLPAPALEAPRAVVVRAARTVRSPSRPVETPPAAPVVAPTVIAPAPAGGGPAPVVARPTEDDQRVLERARSLLGSDPTEALRIAEGVSSTELVEERELIALDALRRVGRGETLRTRGQRFVERFPRSLYAERVRRWLTP